ncbi:hypothetical protein ACA910_017415 [Epithemia clementina (nom. ined.)]
MPTVCGAIIGNSGKFCLVDKACCSVKSHKWAPLGWDQALRQGIQSVLFIQVPGTATAFQTPMVNWDNLSPTCLQELLLIKKPDALWGGMFALLEAKATAKDVEEIGDPYSGKPILGYNEAMDNHNEAPMKNSPASKHFFPKLKSKLADATTPAKLTRAAGLGAAIRLPPIMVLKDMGRDMLDMDYST